MKNFMMKMSFIDTLQNAEQLILAGIFEQISYLEDRYEKDCANFSLVEIDAFFTENPYQQEFMVLAACDLLNRYSIWYKAQKGGNSSISPYAQYSKKRSNAKTQKQLIINYDVVISPQELNSILESFNSIFDKLILLSVYEGLTAIEDYRDLIFITGDSCLVDTNSVVLRSGVTKRVSDRLMQLLLECSEADRFFVNSERTYVKQTRQSNNSCFKKLNLTEDMDSEKVRIKLKGAMQKMRNSIGNKKIATHPLRMSGYLNGLCELGITSDFDNPKILAYPEVMQLAAQYNYNYARGSNYQNAVRKYLIDAE